MPLPPATTRVRMSDGCDLLVKVLDNNPGPDSTTPKPLFIVHHSAVGASDHAETEASYGFLVEHFRVLVFDARGCGGSGKSVEGGWKLSHERWVEDVEELRERMHAPTFYLAGNSYGAVIALEYALAHPSRLDGLVLRAGLAYGPLMAENALGRLKLENGVDRERQERLWKGLLRDASDFEGALGEVGAFFGYKKENGVEEEVKRAAPVAVVDDVEMPEEGGNKDAAPETTSSLFHSTHNAAFSTCLPNFDVRTRLGEIKARTLVVVGKHDWLTPVEGSQEIVDGINGSGGDARLVVFEESGHDPTTEERDRWREVLSEWLRDKGMKGAVWTG